MKKYTTIQMWEAMRNLKVGDTVIVAPRFHDHFTTYGRESVIVTEVYGDPGRTSCFRFMYRGIPFMGSPTVYPWSDRNSGMFNRAQCLSHMEGATVKEIALGGQLTVGTDDLFVFMPDADISDWDTRNAAQEAALDMIGRNMKAMTADELWNVYYTFLPHAAGHGRYDRYRPIRTMWAVFIAGLKIRRSIRKTTLPRAGEIL